MTAKLPFTPEADSYGVTHPLQTVAVQLAGGRPRVRADVDGCDSLVDATWALNYQDYMTFMNFMEVTISMGSLPMLVDLTTNFFKPVLHKCTMVPGTFKTHNVKGISYNISMQLSVEQNRYFFAANNITFETPNKIHYTGPPTPEDFNDIFVLGQLCQVVGAACNDGVHPPVNLDVTTTVSNIASGTQLELSTPGTFNADWLKLVSYTAGTTPVIPNVALVKVPF